MPKGRGGFVEGVPTDSQIEELLDLMGVPPDDEPDGEPVEEADDKTLPGEGLEGEMPPEEEDTSLEEEMGLLDEPLPDEEGEGDEEEGDEEEPTNVVDCLARALANTFAMYLRAHVFHWNVVGPDFVQYHTYLDSLNGELFGAVDPLAEHLRAAGGLAPSGLAEFASLSTVADPGTPQPSPEEMWTELLTANDEVMAALHEAIDAAGDDHGLVNFLADRLDRHGKHAWFLRSLAGQTP